MCPIEGWQRHFARLDVEPDPKPPLRAETRRWSADSGRSRHSSGLYLAPGDSDPSTGPTQMTPEVIEQLHGCRDGGAGDAAERLT